MMTSRKAGQVRPRFGGLIGTTLVFSIFTNLLMLTGPLFMLQVYDRVLASRSEETLVALFFLVAFLYTFYWALEYARGRVISRAGVRVQDAFSAPAFRAIVERAARRAKDRTGTLQDLDAVRTFFASPVILALFDMPWTPFFLAAIFIFHPMLGWVAVAGGGILIVAAILNQLLTSRRVAQASQQAHLAGRFANQVETAGDYVMAQGMGNALMKRWSGLQASAMDQAMTSSDWTGSFSSFIRAFRLFLQSAILAVGAWYVLQNELTAGAMIAASILLGRALAPIDVGVSQWSVAQRARRSWRAICELVEGANRPGPETSLPAPSASLDVSAVTLIRGRNEPPVLDRVSFEIKPGQALGIIGRSGAGKSTLARVLTGLEIPTAGEVRLDGATLAQYGPDRLGAFLGYLPQEILFFDGTVAENIAQMAEHPDDEKVVAAAKKAQAHEIILSLPDGYDTQLSGGSVALSGGQKQRLGLARALYNDPVLLVLDEPNSALDAEGSAALNAAIVAMKAEARAVIIMTHRPMAISTCDMLLVLEGGKVAGSGPRDEVIKTLMANAGAVQRTVQGVS